MSAPETPDHRIGYESSVLPELPRRRFSWTAFIATLACAICFIGGMRWAMSVYEQVLTDFKIDLPEPTKWLVVIARFSMTPVGWVVVLAIPMLAGFVGAKIRPSPDLVIRHEQLIRRLTAAIFALVFCVCFYLIVQFALILPIVELVRGISSSPGGKR